MKISAIAPWYGSKRTLAPHDAEDASFGVDSTTASMTIIVEWNTYESGEAVASNERGQNGHGDPLQTIKGIGAASAEKIQAALEAFWERRKDDEEGDE